jgi:CheY-like chemotaxis protein
MKKILIVEDDSDIRHITKKFLASENFEVLQAENGLHGLELARQSLPDLVICDVNMPFLDGYGLLDQLASNPITALIPFIFLTGLPDRAIEQDKKAWANCQFLSKPFTRTELILAVHSSLKATTTKGYVA